MSKEREILITDLSINAVDGFFYITQKLQTEIRELLTQKREPLSDGEITTNTPKTIPIGERLAFHAGIRWAVHQHGIRGVE